MSILSPLIDLLVELRPGLAIPVAQSLVTEALDTCADVLLDIEWAKQRQSLAPAAIRCAHVAHMSPYAVRTHQTGPVPGDYQGHTS